MNTYNESFSIRSDTKENYQKKNNYKGPKAWSINTTIKAHFSNDGWI